VAGQGRGGVSSGPANMLSFNKLLLCAIGQSQLYCQEEAKGFDL